MGARVPARPVYVLEFAGDDDALAAAEAGAAAEDVEVVAPGLGLARSLDSGRVRTLALTRRAAALVAGLGPEALVAGLGLDALAAHDFSD